MINKDVMERICKGTKNRTIAKINQPNIGLVNIS